MSVVICLCLAVVLTRMRVLEDMISEFCEGTSDWIKAMKDLTQCIEEQNSECKYDGMK